MVWVLGPATATVAGMLVGLVPAARPLTFLRVHAGLLLVVVLVAGAAGVGGSVWGGSASGWRGGVGRAEPAWLDLDGGAWPLALALLLGLGALGGVVAMWSYDRVLRRARSVRPPGWRGAGWGASRLAVGRGWGGTAGAGGRGRAGTPGSGGPGWGGAPGAVRRAGRGVRRGPGGTAEPGRRATAVTTGHLVVCAALEELVFRGVLLGAALAVGGVGGAVLLLVTTALFALSHTELGPGQALAFLPLSVITLALALATGSVIPAVLAHVLLNVRAGLAAGRAVPARVGGWAR